MKKSSLVLILISTFSGSLLLTGCPHHHRHAPHPHHVPHPPLPFDSVTQADHQVEINTLTMAQGRHVESTHASE